MNGFRNILKESLENKYNVSTDLNEAAGPIPDDVKTFADKFSNAIKRDFGGIIKTSNVEILPRTNYKNKTYYEITVPVDVKSEKFLGKFLSKGYFLISIDDSDDFLTFKNVRSLFRFEHLDLGSNGWNYILKL